jgi:hypothetical protein
MKNQPTTLETSADNLSQKLRAALQEGEPFIKPWGPLTRGFPTHQDHECGCGCCPDE